MPSQMASSETSLPCRYSSMSTVAPASPKRRCDEALLDRGTRLLVVLGDGHALAGRQAVGLDDQWEGRFGVEAAQCVVQVVVAAVRAGRRLRVAHDLFGERLAALELRCLAAGTEDEQAVVGEEIADAGDQRRLGTDHGEVDLLTASEGEQRGQILGVDGHVVGFVAGAGVARRAEELRGEPGGGERVDEGVLPAATTDHQDAHAASLNESVRTAQVYDAAGGGQ